MSLELAYKIDKNHQAMSGINNPFMKGKISMISMHMIRGNWSGKIEFTNGMTGGEHRFEASDFADLVSKMEAMIKNLEQ